MQAEIGQKFVEQSMAMRRALGENVAEMSAKTAAEFFSGNKPEIRRKFVDNSTKIQRKQSELFAEISVEISVGFSEETPAGNSTEIRRKIDGKKREKLGENLEEISVEFAVGFSVDSVNFLVNIWYVW